MIPVDRVRIFNRQGVELAQFRASVARSWAIGDEGRAQFTYATRKTEVVNQTLLEFGNWLLIENNMLPSWAGVFDPPRRWSPREVTVSAYTPERVFMWRRGPLEEILTGSPGTVFEKLLYYVNIAETTVLQPGNIYRGGTQMEETINPTTLDNDLRRIVERSGEEYQFRPVVSGGRLIIYCDWMQNVGVDTGAILQEGKRGGNIEDVNGALVEDGDIVNDLLAVGDGESWKSRPIATITNLDSVGKYGLRQSTEEYSGVTTIQTLSDNGSELVSAAKNPVNAYKVNALNIGDTFSHISIGNQFTLRMQNLGFGGNGIGLEKTVRISAMSYNPDIKNKITLVVEDA